MKITKYDVSTDIVTVEFPAREYWILWRAMPSLPKPDEIGVVAAAVFQDFDDAMSQLRRTREVLDTLQMEIAHWLLSGKRTKTTEGESDGNL